jgi:hypothetical protein
MLDLPEIPIYFFVQEQQCLFECKEKIDISLIEHKLCTYNLYTGGDGIECFVQVYYATSFQELYDLGLLRIRQYTINSDRDLKDFLYDRMREFAYSIGLFDCQIDQIENVYYAIASIKEIADKIEEKKKEEDIKFITKTSSYSLLFWKNEYSDFFINELLPLILEYKEKIPAYENVDEVVNNLILGDTILVASPELIQQMRSLPH